MDGKIVPTEKMATEANFAFYQMVGTDQPEYLAVKFPFNAENIAFMEASPQIKA